MHFYATKEDLMHALRSIEDRGAVTYARYGSYPNSIFPTFETAADLPALGSASSDSAVSCAAYVVVPRGVEVAAREIRQSDGVIRYAVDQLLNPLSITFHPGGQRSPDAMLHGRVATASTTPESRKLLARFERALKKDFRKVGAFYVGPEALTLLMHGVRLTAALQSPRSYDLKPPNQPADPTEGTRPAIGKSAGFSRSPGSVDHG